MSFRNFKNQKCSFFKNLTLGGIYLYFYTHFYVALLQDSTERNIEP